MKCGKSAKLMSDYLDGRLAERVVVEFETHIGECASCAEELRATRAMLKCVGLLSVRATPVDCWSHVSRHISSTSVAPAPRWWAFAFRPTVATPAFVTALLLGVLMIWPGNVAERPSENASLAPEYSHYIAAHSRLQRQQAFSDPDVTFVSAELDRASLSSNTIK